MRALVQRRQVLFIPRDKNLDGLAQLGLTLRTALSVIAELQCGDYSSGPVVDRDKPAQRCWIFGCKLEGRPVYIKLVLESLPGGRERLKVLSFHPADFPMKFPLA